MDRTDTVGVQHHRLAQQLGAADDRQIVKQGPGGGGVLEQTSSPGQQGVTSAQGGEYPPHSKSGNGIQPVLPPGQVRVIGQDGDGHLVAGLMDGLLDGLQNGVVPSVGKAVVAAHNYPIFPAADLLIPG